MTTYIMEAKENYDAAGVSLIVADSSSPSTDQYFYTSKINVGDCYDPVRRKIVYASAYVNDKFNNATNSTGHVIWDGITQIASAATYNEVRYKNASVCTKNIDTGVVTFHNCFSNSNLVPNGIGGTDGTARRYTNVEASKIQGPILVDPRTGNFWYHVFGFGALSCGLYMFRLEDDYAQVISPLLGGSNHMVMLGMNDDWTYVWADDDDVLKHVPRTILSDEVTADYLLSYADVAMPLNILSAYWRTAMDTDGNLYLFSSPANSKVFTLWKYEQPTSAPYGGPTVGGGWTDITPWPAGTGPASRTTYTIDGTLSGITSYSKNILWQLPATNELVAITHLRPRDKTAASTNPDLCFFDCTYIDLAGLTYDYHAGFIKGWMTEEWGLGTDASDSAYVVLYLQETDSYKSFHSYTFDGDYTTRYFFATVQRVVAGVYNPASTKFIVILKYRFVSGSAPQFVQMWDEDLWSDYTYMGTAPMKQVVTSTNIDYPAEAGFYDPTTNSFWWSGDTANMAVLDTDYDDRLNNLTNVHSVTPPFLRISFETVTRRRASVRVRLSGQP